MPNGSRPSASYPCHENGVVESQLDNLAGSHSKFHELWTGIVWAIVADYTIGTLIPNKTKTYVLVTTDFLAIGIARFQVIYEIAGDVNPAIEFISVTTLASQDGN